jgi:hypothetical protein
MAFTTFDVNIFGTSHVDLDGSNSNGYSREFVIHVLQVECNQIITNFDMFIEFYAYPFRKGATNSSVTPSPNGLWLNALNIDNMKLNGRPQVIHLDTMTPTSPVALYPTCFISPALPCPSPADIRLCSMAFQTPIPIGITPTGYDANYTDMYDFGINSKLPVNITIIADGCRYSSQANTAITIYKLYNTAEELCGGITTVPCSNPIGFDEKITIS